MIFILVDRQIISFFFLRFMMRQQLLFYELVRCIYFKPEIKFLHRVCLSLILFLFISGDRIFFFFLNSGLEALKEKFFIINFSLPPPRQFFFFNLFLFNEH